jgi:hypothetical protein
VHAGSSCLELWLATEMCIREVLPHRFASADAFVAVEPRN